MKNVILIIFILLIRIISAVVVTTGHPMLFLLLNYATIILLFMLEYNILGKYFEKKKTIIIGLVIFNLVFIVLNTISTFKFYM